MSDITLAVSCTARSQSLSSVGFFPGVGLVINAQAADMIVYASPIYYFDMTAQISAAIQRVYAIGKPAKATKSALLLSSASPNPYDGAIATYKAMLAFTGVADAGIITAAGEENASEEKMAEIRAFAKAL